MEREKNFLIFYLGLISALLCDVWACVMLGGENFRESIVAEVKTCDFNQEH